MSKNIVTDAQIITFTKRSHEIYRRLVEGTLPAEAVLAGLQKLVEGQFPSPTTLAEMIRAGRYDWTNGDITEENFLVDPARFTTVNTKVYHFNKWMSTEAVVAEMADGYEPAFIENLLAYGAENPEEQRKHSIVALGSSCVDRDRIVCSPCLVRFGGDRALNLRRHAGGWGGDYRFLAVRKSST